MNYKGITLQRYHTSQIQNTRFAPILFFEGKSLSLKCSHFFLRQYFWFWFFLSSRSRSETFISGVSAEVLPGGFFQSTIHVKIDVSIFFLRSFCDSIHTIIILTSNFSKNKKFQKKIFKPQNIPSLKSPNLQGILLTPSELGERPSEAWPVDSLQCFRDVCFRETHSHRGTNSGIS